MPDRTTDFVQFSKLAVGTVLSGILERHRAENEG